MSIPNPDHTHVEHKETPESIQTWPALMRVQVHVMKKLFPGENEFTMMRKYDSEGYRQHCRDLLEQETTRPDSSILSLLRKHNEFCYTEDNPKKLIDDPNLSEAADLIVAQLRQWKASQQPIRAAA